MKKAFGIVFLCFISFIYCGLWAQAKNIVFQEEYAFSSLEKLCVNLNHENIQIEKIYGNEVVVEISCNNLTKIPVVQAELQGESKVLNIKSGSKKVTRGDKCTVYIYIPQDFMPQAVELNSISGSITVNKIITESDFNVKTVSGNIFVSEINCDFLNVKSVSGNILGDEVLCSYFRVEGDSGALSLSVLKAPEAQSSMNSVSGDVRLLVPLESDFDYYVESNSGTFNDNFNDFVFLPRGGFTRQFNKGGPVVNLISVSGSITLGKSN